MIKYFIYKTECDNFPPTQEFMLVKHKELDLYLKQDWKIISVEYFIISSLKDKWMLLSDEWKIFWIGSLIAIFLSLVEKLKGAIKPLVFGNSYQLSEIC
ncbi:hypothetical protein [Elizabethkingia bruuniana]|uniref:hypothetical protein n=1 Tax=Elizabethkingia bruuniana TaxID=1756149 RepID=UPI001054D814|nr:hypothetical protein [Elizabethkingia bruuniana]